MKEACQRILNSRTKDVEHSRQELNAGMKRWTEMTSWIYGDTPTQRGQSRYRIPELFQYETRFRNKISSGKEPEIMSDIMQENITFRVLTAFPGIIYEETFATQDEGTITSVARYLVRIPAI
jgi:hypothetical protein